MKLFDKIATLIVICNMASFGRVYGAGIRTNTKTDGKQIINMESSSKTISDDEKQRELLNFGNFGSFFNPGHESTHHYDPSNNEFQPRVGESPTTSNEPSISIAPSISLAPSEAPSFSQGPSSSMAPTDEPTWSGAPSASSSPTMSAEPTQTDEPAHEPTGVEMIFGQNNDGHPNDDSSISCSSRKRNKSGCHRRHDRRRRRGLGSLSSNNDSSSNNSFDTFKNSGQRRKKKSKSSAKTSSSSSKTGVSVKSGKKNIIGEDNSNQIQEVSVY